MERVNLLHKLLQNNTSRYHIEYGGYLSNHLSHGLVALYKLGASEKLIQQFNEDYAINTGGKLKNAKRD
jgi:hypothetical protein